MENCSKGLKYTLLFYKNLVYKNIQAWNRSKIKNIVVILLVAISISFEGFGQKMTFLKNKYPGGTTMRPHAA